MSSAQLARPSPSPLTGQAALTILVAATVMAQGDLEAVIPRKLRLHGGWACILLAGIFAFAAGLLLVAELPSPATPTIRLLVGITLIMSSVDWLFHARAKAIRAA